MAFRPLHAFAVVVLAGASAAQAPKYHHVDWAVVPTIAGTKTLELNLYLPAHASAPVPVVLFVHGGGWSSGSPDDERKFLDLLLDQGVGLATTSYRFSQEAIFPAQVHDVKGAVRFLRSHASELELDACRIGAWGTSAGGHLVSMLALTNGDPYFEGTSGGNLTTSSRVHAAVVYYAGSDLLPINSEFTMPVHYDHDAPGAMIGNLIGFPPGLGQIVANPSAYPNEVALLALASPITHVSHDDPPCFLAHTVLDSIIPVSQSVRLHDALVQAGVPSSLRLVPGNMHHGSLGPSVDSAAAQFLHLVLAGPCIP